MTISAYSFFMAIVWSSVWILFFAFLQRKTKFGYCYQFMPLIALAVLTIARLLIPIEMVGFTQVISSKTIVPTVLALVDWQLFQFHGIAVRVLHLMIGVWIAAAVFFIVRYFWNIWKDCSKIRNAYKVDFPQAQMYLDCLLHEKGKDGKIKLIVLPGIEGAKSRGFFKPAILLPAREMMSLDGYRLNYLICHEANHLLGGDMWIKLGFDMLCCIMWWNPLIHLLRSDLENILEYRCDRAVTKKMTDREKVAYGQFMKDEVGAIIERTKQKKFLHIGDFTSNSYFCKMDDGAVLTQRIHLLFDKEDKRIPKAAFIAAFLALIVLSYSIILQPLYEPPIDDSEDKLSMTSENTYILAASDGNYYLIYEGVEHGRIPTDILQNDPYCFLPLLDETG